MMASSRCHIALPTAGRIGRGRWQPTQQSCTAISLLPAAGLNRAIGRIHHTITHSRRNSQLSDLAALS
jgi:hypothetical protein